MFHDSSQHFESDVNSPEDFVIESVGWKPDLYTETLKKYLGDHIEQHERLKDILVRLNPSDYIDWDEVEYKSLEPSSSSES